MSFFDLVYPERVTLNAVEMETKVFLDKQKQINNIICH